MNNDLKELLAESVSEMLSLIGMMEPYYTQAGADASATELIDRIEMVLPYRQVIKGRYVFACEQCPRLFSRPSALSQHMSKHGMTTGARRNLERRLDAEARDTFVDWPTKADYLQHATQQAAKEETIGKSS